MKEKKTTITKKILTAEKRRKVRQPEASPDLRFGAVQSATQAGDGIGKCGSEKQGGNSPLPFVGTERGGR